MAEPQELTDPIRRAGVFAPLAGASHADIPRLAPNGNRVIPGTLPGAVGNDGHPSNASPLGTQRYDQ